MNMHTGHTNRSRHLHLASRLKPRDPIAFNLVRNDLQMLPTGNNNSNNNKPNKQQLSLHPAPLKQNFSTFLNR
jgi:hypothetical protein